MKSIIEKLLLTLVLAFGIGAAHAATVFVPSYGNSGLQTFSKTFQDAVRGTVYIGISDQGDDDVTSTLAVSNFAGGMLGAIPFTISTDPAVPVNTSSYLNAFGHPGTDGETRAFEFSVGEGGSISFDWIFSTIDYDPYEDFAFVEIWNSDSLISYDVIAQIDGENTVPTPGTLALLGIGLAAFGLRRKQIA